MALTEKERQIVEHGKKQGKSKSEVLNALSKFNSEDSETSTISSIGDFAEDAAKDIKEEATGLVNEDIQQRQENVTETKQAQADDEQTFGESALQVAGQAAGTIGDAIGRTAKGVGKALLPQEQEEQVGEAIQSGAQSIAQNDKVRKVVQNFQRFQEENPRAARNINAALGIGELVADVAGGGVASRAGREVTEQGARIASEGVEQAGRVARGAADTAEGVGRVAKSGAERVTGLAGRARRSLQRKADEMKEVSQLPKPEREAVRTGIDQRDIVPVRNATEQEADVMQDMLESAEKSVVQGKRVDEASEPEAIVGEQIMDRFKHLQRRDQELGERLGNAIRDLPEQSVDVSTARRELDDTLDRFRVQRTEDGELDFSNSVLAGQKNQQMRSMLSDLDDSMGEQMTPDEIWTVRKRLFRNLDKAKKQLEVNPADEAAIDNIRTTLGNQLDNFAERQGAEDIKELRTKVAQIKDAKSEVEGLVGTGFDNFTEEDFLNLELGEVAGRILNRRSAKYKKALNKIEETAKETGFDANTDVSKITEFADILERNIGTTRSRSFRAETGGAPNAAEGARRALGGAARFDPGEAAEGVKDVAKSFEQNAPERVRALRSLLNQKLQN